MTDKTNSLDELSPSVQSHLAIVQGVIQRMASNSTQCKTWCITIVSAIIVIIADKGKPNLVWIALLPSILFFCLDAYYLALEKSFRFSYNDFVRELHSGSIVADDLYFVLPKGSMSRHQIDAIKSFSIWGFYSGLILLIVSARFIILA